jgi:hypothetical protein
MHVVRAFAAPLPLAGKADKDLATTRATVIAFAHSVKARAPSRRF